MKLVDANLLLYAINTDAPNHLQAKTWLENVLSGTEPIAFAWIVLLAFLRLSTKAVVFPRPLKVDEALSVLELWLSQPSAQVVHPTDRHLKVLTDLIAPVGTGGNLTTDAHLAALAIEHGAELCSCDNDFRRYPGLRWTNPLEQ